MPPRRLRVRLTAERGQEPLRMPESYPTISHRQAPGFSLSASGPAATVQGHISHLTSRCTMAGFDLIFEMMYFFTLASGSTPTDLLALVEPRAYFKTRQIELTPAQMMELAAKDPSDPKSQIAQLTALKYL